MANSNLLTQLNALLSKVENMSDTIRREAAVFRAELAERQRLGLNGDAAVQHYNEYMDKSGMSYLKIS